MKVTRFSYAHLCSGCKKLGVAMQGSFDSETKSAIIVTVVGVVASAVPPLHGEQTRALTSLGSDVVNNNGLRSSGREIVNL